MITADASLTADSLLTADGLLPFTAMMNTILMSAIANATIAYAGGSSRCVFEAAFADPMGISATRTTARIVAGPVLAEGAVVTVTQDGGTGIAYTVREVEADAVGMVMLFLS